MNIKVITLFLSTVALLQAEPKIGKPKDVTILQTGCPASLNDKPSWEKFADFEACIGAFAKRKFDSVDAMNNPNFITSMGNWLKLLSGDVFKEKKNPVDFEKNKIVEMCSTKGEAKKKDKALMTQEWNKKMNDLNTFLSSEFAPFRMDPKKTGDKSERVLNVLRGMHYICFKSQYVVYEPTKGSGKFAVLNGAPIAEMLDALGEKPKF